MHQPSPENKRTLLFLLHRSQSNHHKQCFSVTTSKISYNMIQPQVLLCVPTCGCKFHAYVSTYAQHLQPVPNQKSI